MAAKISHTDRCLRVFWNFCCFKHQVIQYKSTIVLFFNSTLSSSQCQTTVRLTSNAEVWVSKQVMLSHSLPPQVMLSHSYVHDSMWWTTSCAVNSESRCVWSSHVKAKEDTWFGSQCFFKLGFKCLVDLSHTILLLSLLLFWSPLCKAGREWGHSNSPKTPTPHNQLGRKKKIKQ